MSLLALAGPDAGWDVGENLDKSSAVQAVVDWFGPSTFREMENAPPATRATISRAFGDDIEVWRKASPVTWVRAGAPP